MRRPLHIHYINLTPGRCSAEQKTNSSPLVPVQQHPTETLRGGLLTPVPVWVGVDGPCDGYEQPRDESCLQGQLEGDFLADNRDLVLVKSRLGTGDTVTIYMCLPPLAPGDSQLQVPPVAKQNQ